MSRFPALASRDFRIYVFGNLLSNVGSQIQVWTIAWHVYQLTGSSVMVGLLGLVRVGPLLLFSLIGGAIADQTDRRKVMLVGQGSMMLVALAFGWMTARETASVGLIYALVAINGAVRAFEGPSRQALVPSLVPREHMQNAFALNGVQWRLSDVIGPLLAGVIIASPIGLAGAYFVNAASFVAVLIALARLGPRPPDAVVDRIASLADLRAFLGDGIRFVRSAPIVRSALWIDFWATLFSAADALLPAFATSILHLGPSGYGMLGGAVGFGALVGATAMSVRPPVDRPGRWVIAAVAVYGLATIGFGVSENLVMALGFLALTGAADMVSTVLRQTIRQMATPDSMRGRMSSIASILQIGGPQLGDFEAGAVAGAVGERWSVAIGGLASMAIAAHWWRRSPLPGAKQETLRIP